MMAGAMHENDRLPVIVLGGGGGKIRGGRVIDYQGKPDRQLCRLFLSLKHKSAAVEWIERAPHLGEVTDFRGGSLSLHEIYLRALNPVNNLKHSVGAGL
jgi:hypothetical protein